MPAAACALVGLSARTRERVVSVINCNIYSFPKAGEEERLGRPQPCADIKRGTKHLSPAQGIKRGVPSAFHRPKNNTTAANSTLSSSSSGGTGG